MNIAAFEVLLGVAKKFIPTLEAIVSKLPLVAGPVNDDVKTVISDVLKIISDLQAAFLALEEAVKGGSPTPPPAV